VDRHRHAIAYAIMVLSSLALLPALDSSVHGDVALYQSVTEDLLAGKLPYRDRELAYPPYAVPVFLLPRLFGGSSYPYAFMCFALVADWLLKLSLFAMGSKQLNKFRSFLPLLCYCVAIPLLRFFFLQRYDIWPSFICLLALWLFCAGRPALSGFCLAIGAGVKVYPLVFLPPLLVLAARQGRARRFVAGAAAGFMPIAVLSFILPWWRFAALQGDRGLQCESLYASLLWLAHLAGFAQAKWGSVKAWIEVQGPLAAAILPWTRLLWVTTVLFSVALASWAAARCEIRSIGQVARLLLVPLLAFVAFNQVLSPQFMIWILPVAVLAMSTGKVWPVFLIVPATMLTPIIFPALPGHYGTGLLLPETLVLVARNLVLVTVWALLVRELLQAVRRAHWTAQYPKTQTHPATLR